ncbi:MAG: hypothetical protein PVG07_13590 [Acidobacteriota bacterium]|jgi:uncharacterized membrane protein
MLSLVDTILNRTSLPNLHPAMVHFPIALFPLAIAFDLVVLVGRRTGLDRVTAWLFALAAVAAAAAVWAGERAGDALTGLPDDVRARIHEHEEWAEWFLYAAVAVALARIVLAWWQLRRHEGGGLGLPALRVVVLVAALAAGVLLFGTADRGGALVYRSGVAVMAVEAPDSPAAGAASDRPAAREREGRTAPDDDR